MTTLIHQATKAPVQIGDALTDFRGDSAVVASIEAPRKPSSTGRIYTTDGMGYFPSVFGCTWIGRTDRG